MHIITHDRDPVGILTLCLAPKKMYSKKYGYKLPADKKYHYTRQAIFKMEDKPEKNKDKGQCEHHWKCKSQQSQGPMLIGSYSRHGIADKDED